MRRTVEMLDRRGYAVTPERLAGLCLGGPIPTGQVLAAVAGDPDLAVEAGLVVMAPAIGRAPAIRARALHHQAEAGPYLAMARRFVGALVSAAPFIRCVSIAGSLASGGFQESDDVDLNLVVDDGHRHLAYLLLNGLGLAHALAHRGKPVDELTRRPLAPRLMTANLILEVSEWRPLARLDADMALELLLSEPVFGAEVLDDLVASNPGLLVQFPQLAGRPRPAQIAPPARRLPAALFPGFLDRPAAWLGGAAWRYMQWTRRHHPDALARVAFVRSTMRPYTLFDEAGP